MIKLFIENKDSSAAVTPIRWCIDHLFLADLCKKGIRQVHILLAVVRYGHGDSWQEVKRYVLPVDRLIEWIQFPMAGRYTIYATIVTDCRLKEARERFLTRGGYKYAFSLFSENGEFRYANEMKGMIDVVVPQEFFAKEPPAWERKWVNLFFESRPIDQCDYRRRRIFAYTLQPILVSVWLAINLHFRLVAASFLTMCLFREVDWRPIVHPFEMPISRIWEDMKPSIIFWNKNGEPREVPISLLTDNLKPVLWVILGTPLGGLALTGMAYAMNLFQQLGITVHDFPGVLFLMTLFAFGVEIAICLYLGIRKAVVTVVKKYLPYEIFVQRQHARLEANRLAEEEFKKFKLELGQRQLQEQYEEWSELLTCSQGNLAPSLNALPRSRRTVYLRFKDLKAKLCRPFAY